MLYKIQQLLCADVFTRSAQGGRELRSQLHPVFVLPVVGGSITVTFVRKISLHSCKHLVSPF